MGARQPILLDLSEGMLRGTGIIYYHIGTLALAIQRFLGILAGLKVLSCPAPGQSPAEAHLLRRIDKQQLLT